MRTPKPLSDPEFKDLIRRVANSVHPGGKCNCPLCRLSKEERTALIDRAIDKTNQEVIANGGTLPDYSEELGVKNHD